MSKRDEIQSESISLIGGFISQDIPQENEVKTKKNEQKKETKKDIEIPTNNNSKLTFDSESNSYNKKNNKSMTIRIDADLYDFVCNIENISFIESLKCGKIKSQTKTDYINDIIRDRYYKLIGAKDTDKSDDIIKKWLDYKNKSGL